MKERGEIVSSASLYESTLSTAIPISSERIHACVEKQYPRQSLPRVGKGASEASRIGFWRYEKERSRLSQVRRLREHPSAAEKGSQPRLAVPLAPSKGRGSRGHSLLPMEGGAPKGRRLDGGSGMKKSGEIISGRRFTKAPSARKQLIKPIYSYKKRKSNAANDFNVICRSGYRYMREKSEAVHFYD